MENVEGIRAIHSSNVMLNHDVSLRGQKEDQKFSKLMKNKSKNVHNTEENELWKTTNTPDFLSEIEEAEAGLSEEITLENLKKYKEKITQFIKFYIKNHIKVKRYSIADEQGYMQSLFIIERVDDKIQQLSDELLDNPVGHLKILKEIGEIRGLILRIVI